MTIATWDGLFRLMNFFFVTTKLYSDARPRVRILIEKISHPMAGTLYKGEQKVVHPCRVFPPWDVLSSL